VRDVSSLANLAKAPFTDFIVNKCTHDVNTENSNMGIPYPRFPKKSRFPPERLIEAK
jgi:hypothetical protein